LYWCQTSKGKEYRGIVAWTEEDVAKYQAFWPVGTKERVWLDVLFYLGLRRGDAVQIGRQHVRVMVWLVSRLKRAAIVLRLFYQFFPYYKKTLDNSPTSDLAFICGASGQPLKKEILAICSVRLATRQVSTNQPMGCVKSVLPARPMQGQRLPNSKPYSAGQTTRCPHFIPRQQTGANSPAMPSKNLALTANIKPQNHPLALSG